MNEKVFAEWLKDNRNIGKSSIYKYTRSIDIIGREMESYGLQETNLYTLKDTKLIEDILISDKFMEKDLRGHRMYSVALNHFKNFIKDIYEYD